MLDLRFGLSVLEFAVPSFSLGQKVNKVCCEDVSNFFANDFLVSKLHIIFLCSADCVGTLNTFF